MYKRRFLNSYESVWPSLALTIKQAFHINKTSLPWEKAINAGICSGLPVLVGLLLGNLEYGLIAGIGGFTYLYTFNVPYAHRAKKLVYCMLGMTLSVGLGTLTAPFPLAAAITVGLIGTIAVFVFGAFEIKGPAALFFVLAFLMSAGMPLNPSLAPLRAGLVLLGGALSWLLGMIGFLYKPYESETQAVKKLYVELSSFIDSVGTEKINEARKRSISALRSAEDLLHAGRISWRTTVEYQRLVLLYDQANRIFLEVLEHFMERESRLPSEYGTFVRNIVHSLDRKKNEIQMKQLTSSDEDTPLLAAKISDAAAIISNQSVHFKNEPLITRPSPIALLSASFDKNSIVFLTAARYGFILAISGIIAYSFNFHRSFWIALSCASVMSGSTIIATFHRAIQRSLGTIFGITIATITLYLEPKGIILVIAIFLLTALTELAIVFNYGIAALFITANAMLMAESTTKVHNISYFASARIIDVLIGVAIGLIGTLLIGAKQASSLLPHLMAKTIRSQQQFLMELFSEQGITTNLTNSIERRKMQTNLTHLRIIFTTAQGEIPINKRALELLQPAILSIEHLSYLLESCIKFNRRPILTDEDSAKFLLAFHSMANAVEKQQAMPIKAVPEIKGFSKIKKEIEDLQDALQAFEKRTS